jgi:predicted ATP-dependent serine protease
LAGSFLGCFKKGSLLYGVPVTKEIKKMLQNVMTKPQASQQKLSFNTPEIDELFPGFTVGEFALIHGSASVTTITSLLCIRAQLPAQLGGLGSNIVYIDCTNTFTQNSISHLAKINHLNPTIARNRIFNFAAFTAYQLTSLIMDKLEEKVKGYNAKLVIISDIASLFLDSAIPRDEAQNIYVQIIDYLISFAKKNQIIIVATYPHHENSIRNSTLKKMTQNKANTVLSYYKTPYTAELNLEKHPTYILGTAEPPSENITLTSFFYPI